MRGCNGQKRWCLSVFVVGFFNHGALGYMEVEDLFCGVGGFTCGALMEGAVVSSGVDNNDAALRAWLDNVPTGTSRLHEIKVGEALP